VLSGIICYPTQVNTVSFERRSTRPTVFLVLQTV